MTIVDLRMEYKQSTGDPYVPVSHDYYDDVDYVLWLEEQLLKRIEYVNSLPNCEPITKIS